MLIELKLERIRRGIPLWRLARDLCIHPSTLSLIENGRIQPKDGVLEKIRRHLQNLDEPILSKQDKESGNFHESVKGA